MFVNIQELNFLDPKPSLICEVKHSRPAGRFRWFLGEEKETEVENSNPASVVETSNGFVEMSQVFTFDPSPDYTGKKLFCEYIQVQYIIEVSCNEGFKKSQK